MKFSEALLDTLNCRERWKRDAGSLQDYLESLDRIDSFFSNKESEATMTNEEKLTMAQQLLSDVYHEASISGDETLESLMSVADSCICEALTRCE